MNRYSAFDELLEGAQVIGFDYTYLYLNEVTAMQAKTTVEALVGKKMHEAFPGIENTKVYKLIGDCLKEKKQFSLINEFDHPDGDKGWYELKIQPVEHGALVLSHDITNIKRAEETIKDYNTKLEEEVDQRVSEIAEQRVIIEQQNKRLLESNERLDEFTNLVAHDLKAPIRNIKSLIGFIEDDEGICEQSLDEFEKLKETSDKMDNLVEDLLLFSKYQNIDLENQNCKLEEVFYSVKNRFEDDIIFGESDLSINVDAQRFTEVLVNIIGNGLKYNQSESKIIEVKFNAETKELSIVDNGIGIPEKYHNKVFAPLQRFEAGYEGTGLGLSMVKRILDRQNIPIRFESEVGKGTTFYLNLSEVI